MGNRTLMHLLDTDGDFVRDVTWTLEYNDLNQLVKRYTGSSWSGSVAGEERWETSYDDNGNLTSAIQETYNGSVWSESEEWVYEWNPRDQMTRAVKYAGGSADNAGSVDYEYCLSCDGALSKRLEYGPGSGSARGTLLAGLRYEYDGLNVLRVDELYDNDINGLETNDAWRAREANTHRPGSLGALLAKRVYEYPSATSGTPSGNEDYYYGHDPVGNVTVVFDSNGDEVYHFTQDAFGNELKTATLGGSDWADARGAGVTEHQTGKWMDEFTGLYYFQARWMDAEVGRFVGRDPAQSQWIDMDTNAGCGSCSTSSTVFTVALRPHIIGSQLEGSDLLNAYSFCENNPISLVDVSGRIAEEVLSTTALISEPI